MDFDDLVAKAAYCVRMMRLARWMSETIDDDYERRVVGRMVLVFVPTYVDTLFALVARPGLADRARKSARGEVRTIRSTFEAFHDRIRHDLAAHRDDLRLDLAIEAWNEIDSETLQWFVDAAVQCLDGVVASHSLIQGRIRPFIAEGDAAVAAKLRADRPTVGIRVSADALALSRGDVTLVPVHEVQTRVAVLMSIADHLAVCDRLIHAIGKNIECYALLKSMLVIDSINLVDGIYGSIVGAAAARSAPLLDILERGDFGGAESLRTSAASVDLGAVETVRLVRNECCAHLDPRMTLAQITEKLVDLDHVVISAGVVVPAWGAVRDACSADMRTRMLLIDARLHYALGVSSTPGVRAYDRSTHGSAAAPN